MLGLDPDPEFSEQMHIVFQEEWAVSWDHVDVLMRTTGCCLKHCVPQLPKRGRTAGQADANVPLKVKTLVSEGVFPSYF